MGTARSARTRPRGRLRWFVPPLRLRTGLIACAGSLVCLTAAAAQPVEPGKASPPKPPVPEAEARPKSPDAPPEREPEAPPQDPAAPEFPISHLVLQYHIEHPALPPMDELLGAATVALGVKGGDFVAPDQGDERLTLTLLELERRLAAEPTPKFSRQALRLTLQALVRELGRRGLIGIIVEVDPDDLEIRPDGEREVWNDLRKEDGRTELRARVYAPVVTQVRTVAAGDRVTKDKVNNPVHARVLRNSPVRPEEPGNPERNDLLRKDLLDDYVLRLNRIPGRRTDIAITGGEAGDVTLDYLVRESNPLLLYFQVSNTGTKETNEWRERLGFQLVQLADRDDVLSLDYVTAAFNFSHVVNASYEFPIGDLDRLRARVYASYSQFDASEVGVSAENFSGRSWIIGGELAWNVFQHREVFLDLVAGLRYQNVMVDNQTVLIKGQTGFFIPSLGVRLERTTEESSTSLSFGVEGNVPGVATNAAELNALGRLATDDAWVAAPFHLEHTFFLEPIFDADNYRAGKSTLAHEIALSVRGQAAFDHRLVPNFEQVAGGLYSVRGYPESVVAGDTVIIASAEYRLHIPRLLGIQEEPGTLFGESFRWAPQQPYGRPDWDLIVRAFVDAAKTINSRRLPFESDQTLLSTGLGIELVYRRNLSFRVDWGCVLDAVPGKAERGDNRFHFLATLLF